MTDSVIFWVIVCSAAFLMMLAALSLGRTKALAYTAGAIIAASAAAVWAGDRLSGHAKWTGLPDEFEMVWYVADEDSGFIYLWVTVEPDPRPVYFRIPYTREAHEALEKARDKMANGVPVEGTAAEEGTGGTVSLGDRAYIIQEPPQRHKTP